MSTGDSKRDTARDAEVVLARADARVGDHWHGPYEVHALSVHETVLRHGPSLPVGTPVQLFVRCPRRISFDVKAEVFAHVDEASGGGLRLRFFRLPTALAAAIPSIVQLAYSSEPGDSCTVLVVDDCPIAGRAIARDLRRMGLTVVNAKTPLEALDQLSRAEAPIMAAIVDFHLGQSLGTELLDFLRTEYPAVRRVFFSADGEACEFERSQHPARSQSVLSKPWDLASLEDALGQARPE